MSRTRVLALAAEVGLAAVTLAAVLGMGRLFADGGWLGPLAISAAAAHTTAAATRRRGLSLASSAAVMLVGAALVTSWTSYWSTTAVGIPTGDTWSTMRADLSDAWLLYQDVVAPAPVAVGFVVASSLAIWFIAYVADWAAFRLWVPFEATLPAGTLFLFTALLGTERGRGWAIGLFAGSILAFLLVHRMSRQDATSHWVAERGGPGQRSLLAVGAALGTFAVLTGTIVGPAVPGADAPGVIDPRSLREGDDSRVTISPLVDIQSRLVNQSALEVFQVRSPQPAYWRLTSLERFDGRIWSSRGSYDDASGELPTSMGTSAAVEDFEQIFDIRALAAIWLPSAYQPRSLDADGVDVLYEKDSSTLIVDRSAENSDGFVYSVTSSAPRITAADLAGSSGEVPAAIRDRYLTLPDGFSPAVVQLANEITAAAATPYEAALALQDHLRAFTYDLEVQSGHRSDLLERFLFETQRGYCEQFAGAYAAMARAIGLPARVAVGFTQGVVDPADPTLFHVRGEHAHAWPEVFLAGAGWVSFEPTPGRGQPFAEDYTGVPVAQASTSAPGVATTAPPTTTAAPDATIPSDASRPNRLDELDTTGGSGADGEATPERSLPSRFVIDPLRRLVPIAVLALMAYLLAVPTAHALRQRLRRRRATTPAERIGLAWTEAAEAAELVGYRTVPSDTFGERAQRLAAHLPPDAAPTVLSLARRLEAASYAPQPPDELDAELAEEASAVIAETARAAAGWRARVGRWLDARPWVRRWRVGQLRHRQITTTVRSDHEGHRELVGSGETRDV